MKKREVKLLDKHTEKLHKHAKQSPESSDDNKSCKSNDSWTGEPLKTSPKSKNKKSGKANSPNGRAKKQEQESEFLSFADIEDSAFNVKNSNHTTKVKDDIEEKISQKFDKGKYPWLSKRTLKIKDIFLFLHSEILDFVEFIRQTEEDKQMREEVVERIKKVVQKAYPDAKVLIFGSCATGINLPQSDIDLLVYYPAVRELTMINKLTSELIRADICASIEPIK